MRLDGKVAIVTGAANGIGRACAARLAKEGAKVVLADVADDEGEEAAADIVAGGGEATFLYCDVSERLDVRNLIAGTLEAYGAVDILINNAGITSGAPFLELEEDDFDRVIRINLKGTFLTAQAAARQMVTQIEEGHPAGCIINMSSINAVLALPNQVAYTASKGGVAQLTKAMAVALAPHGIRVNAIGPGSVDTRMLENVMSDKNMRTRMLARTPLGRPGKTDEIASVAAFLASDDASYITGQTIYADGGRLGLNLTVDALPSSGD